MRRSILVAFACAAALSACGEEANDQQGLTNWEDAPPLLAGPQFPGGRGGQTGPGAAPAPSADGAAETVAAGGQRGPGREGFAIPEGVDPEEFRARMAARRGGQQEAAPPAPAESGPATPPSEIQPAPKG